MVVFTMAEVVHTDEVLTLQLNNIFGGSFGKTPARGPHPFSARCQQAYPQVIAACR